MRGKVIPDVASLFSNSTKIGSSMVCPYAFQIVQAKLNFIGSIVRSNVRYDPLFRDEIALYDVVSGNMDTHPFRDS